MLRANPNPPQAAPAPRAPQATTNKDKESHHRSVREIVIQITTTTDLISDVLPYGALWYAEPNAIDHAISYAKFRSRSRDAAIRVFDDMLM